MATTTPVDAEPGVPVGQTGRLLAPDAVRGRLAAPGLGEIVAAPPSRPSSLFVGDRPQPVGAKGGV